MKYNFGSTTDENLLKSNVYSKPIFVDDETEIYQLVFIVWEDGRTYCFINLEDNSLYWYATITIDSMEKEFRRIVKTNTIDIKKELDKIVENYTEEDIEKIIRDYHYYSVCDRDDNIISQSLFYNLFRM